MPRNIKKISKNNDKKSKEIDNRKYKKGEDSSGESDNNSSGSENDKTSNGVEKTEQEKFDMKEYRKMLAGMFPSKYMNDRVSKLEKVESSKLDTKKSGSYYKKKSEESGKTTQQPEPEVTKKITRSMVKVDKQDIEKSKKKSGHNPPPPVVDENANDDTSSTSTTCSDNSYSESDEETFSAGFGEFAKEQLQKGKFNIVINLMNDKRRDGSNSNKDGSEYDSESEEGWESDYDDDDEDYDSEEEYDSDDSDDYDDSDDESDDESDDPDYHPDEDEDATSGGIKIGKDVKRYNNGNAKQEHVSKKSNNESDSIETIQKIKEQMEELLKLNKHDSIARETLSNMVKKEKEYKKVEEQKMKNKKKHHVKQFKKMLRKKNSTNDLKYFKDNLSTEEQTAVLKELEHLNKLTITDKPYRLSLLQSNIPQAFKAIALKKITNLRHMEPGAGEYYKIKNWVDTFMQIPFGRYSNLPLTISDGIEKCHDFMENAKSTLDGAVYGLNDAKMQIMQMLGQWISNPTAMGTAIAINGPMGTGKTSLVKEGISKILNREFAFIPLGGATDSSYLEGHSYTYEGSTWGKIVDILIRSKSMNPVIYFDELDKISETPKGEEIIGILTHLTDTTQNSQFHDKYFAEIDFDLSKCLFIFSYNDPLKVNPILLDRMYKIKTTGYKVKDKIVIAKQYLIPKIRYEVNFKEGDIIIPDTTLNYIIENYTDKEDGVRNLKRCIEIVYKKLNLYRLVKPGTTLFENDNTLLVEFPFTVTSEIVNNLIKKDESSLNRSAINMYL